MEPSSGPMSLALCAISLAKISAYSPSEKEAEVYVKMQLYKLTYSIKVEVNDFNKFSNNIHSIAWLYPCTRSGIVAKSDAQLNFPIDIIIRRN